MFKFGNDCVLGNEIVIRLREFIHAKFQNLEDYVMC